MSSDLLVDFTMVSCAEIKVPYKKLDGDITVGIL